MALDVDRRKLAFVLPAAAGGGAERVLLTLLNALDRRRFAPELVMFERTGPLTHMIPGDLPVHVLEKPRLRNALLPLVARLRRMKPAVILSSLGYVNISLLAMKRLLPNGARIVVRESSLPSIALREAPSPRLFAAAYRRLYPRAACIVATSRRMATEFETDFAIPPRLIEVLPNPIDSAAIRAGIRTIKRQDGAGPRFVTAGRLVRVKGYDRLLEMMAEIDDTAHLTIVGEGPEFGHLSRQADSLGLGERVIFAGFQENPWEWIAGADVLLLPSRREGMPNVALEALACGTRVIATPESGGIGEVADLAAPGAVRVARAGEEFGAAMRDMVVDRTDRIRPSLLPPSFRLDLAVQEFERLMARL